MKILYINIGMHAKNHNALMNYKNISFSDVLKLFGNNKGNKK